MLYKFIRLFNTLKYLKFVQVYYRIYYLIRNKLISREPKRRKVPISDSIFWSGGIRFSNRYSIQNSFEFLNIQHQFPNEIDWNFDAFGKLWTYNLNYFDFLNQSDMSKETGLQLIQDYVSQEATLKDGKEPYPISLRVINWMKFLSENKIKESKIDETLYHHTRTLMFNLEYHLLANHLLENAFALLFGAYYFQDEKFYSISKKILISQLNEQILKDGAHYELSPMYHQILLHRLLDCIQLILSNSDWIRDDLLSILKDKAQLMKSWLSNVTYMNGDIPMVNDAAYGIAPLSNSLFAYSNELEIKNICLPLSDSGYRMITSEKYELFLDVGAVACDYQPAHYHSDIFSFELRKQGIPIVVDTGTSTYEKDQNRERERIISAHNTVQIKDMEAIDVWGGFRVGKRGCVTILEEVKGKISATHNGFSDGYLHTRTFLYEEDHITIVDKLNKQTNYQAFAYFHLHSEITKPEVTKNTVTIASSKIIFSFEHSSHIEIIEYALAKGFNNKVKAFQLKINFDDILETKILL